MLKNLTKKRAIAIGLSILIAIVMVLSGITVVDRLSPAGKASQSSILQVGIGQKIITIGTAEASGAADYTCTGTNDNVIFQTAINALPLSGGKINVLGGTYSFSARITLKNNTWIQGVGSGTTIFIANGSNVDAIYATGTSNITISDLVINGNGANQITYSYGIDLVNCDNIKLSNLYVYDFTPQGSRGIYLDVCSNYYLNNIEAAYCDYAGVSIGGSTGNSSVGNLNEIYTHDNKLWGTFIWATGNYTISGLHISDFTSARNGNNAIPTRFGGGLYFHYVKNSSITNFTINDNYSRGFLPQLSSNITISNGSIYGTLRNPLDATDGGEGLDAYGLSYSSISNVISNNNRRVGIDIEGGYDALNNPILEYYGHVLIANCQTYYNDTTGITAWACPSIRINNCFSWNNCQDLSIWPVGERPYAAGLGIYSSNNSAIENCRTWDDQTVKTQPYGLIVDTFPAFHGTGLYLPSYAMIVGNDVMESGNSGNYTISGTGHLIRSNLGIPDS